ncbi:MAG: type VI secretion system baseplate subunit TssG [Gemmatimonadales bacterium]
MEAAPLTQPGTIAAAPKGGRAGTPPNQPALEDEVRERATAFDFFQAVRVLERLLPERSPVGRFGEPRDEIARFTVNPDIAFPASEIYALDLPPNGGQARMAINFLGLTGPEGVLPYAYSELIMERVRARDTALRDFLDLFHHRLVSLFYAAWEKYRFEVAHERDRRDLLTQHLKDLIGLGVEGLQHRLAIRDEALVFYAGLLGPGQRSAAALEQLIADYFGVPTQVEQFVGGWYRLADENQCAVGLDDDASEQLGGGAVVGDEVWDPPARIRIRLGPLTRRQYDQFLPGAAAHEPLRTLTRFFSGDQVDFEVQLVLVRDEVPGCMLGAPEPGTPLGWCTWMRSRPFSRDPDDTVLTL